MYKRLRCLDDPFFLNPPQPFYHRDEQELRGSGGVNCGWGAAFAMLWESLYYSTSWLEAKLYPWFKNYTRLLPEQITSFTVFLRASGPLFEVFPGENGCLAGVMPHHGMGSVDRFGTHNIDTKAQTLTLWTLASLWFAQVADVLSAYSTLDGLQEYCAKLKREHDEDVIIQRYTEAPRYRGGLYRVKAEGTEYEHYYAFADSHMPAQQRVEAVVGNRLFNYYIGLPDRVDPLEYSKLPLLIPLLGTEPEPDTPEEDDDDES